MPRKAISIFVILALLMFAATVQADAYVDCVAAAGQAYNDCQAKTAISVGIAAIFMSVAALLVATLNSITCDHRYQDSLKDCMKYAN